MTSPSAPAEHHAVALVGFSAFERSALGSFFRLALQRSPAYRQVEAPELADFLIADADRASALATVRDGDRLHDTVFVGAHAPEGAMAWLQRPIDPVHIVRELDALVEQRRSGAPYASPARHRSAAPPAFNDAFGSAATPAPAARQAPPVASVDLLLGDLHAPAIGLEPAQPGGARDVLVVEDSAIARSFLAQRLKRLGYHVHLAADGEQAAQMLALRPYAIVFVDIVLGEPGSIDGLQICRSIKLGAAHPGGPPPAVVIVTGLTGSADRVRGSLAGCDAYLTKPVAEREFVAALAEVDMHFDSGRAGS